MSKNEHKIKSFWNEQWIQSDFKYPTKKCDYYFSNYGRIKSVHKVTSKENLINGSISHIGLRQINVRLADNKHGSMFPHRLVAEHFVNKSNSEQNYIWHIDGDKLNNHHENLEWITKKEWMDRLIKKGSYAATHKSRYKTYKLNETKVAIIKKLLIAGKTRRKMIAKRFGITTTQLKRIERGENWGYVKPME